MFDIKLLSSLWQVWYLRVSGAPQVGCHLSTKIIIKYILSLKHLSDKLECSFKKNLNSNLLIPKPNPVEHLLGSASIGGSWRSPKVTPFSTKLAYCVCVNVVCVCVVCVWCVCGVFVYGFVGGCVRACVYIYLYIYNNNAHIYVSLCVCVCVGVCIYAKILSRLHGMIY